MKSINNKIKIVKENISFERIIAGGLAVFSLAGAIWGLSENINDGEIMDSKEYMYYSSKYNEYFDNNPEDNFDPIFTKIYNDAKFICNNQEYDGATIYIVQYDDNSVHLVYSSNNKYDLITGDMINAKKTRFVKFRESSAFYELYENGIITDSEINITNDYLNYISNWNGQNHYQTSDTSATRYAFEESEKKFGGR